MAASDVKPVMGRSPSSAQGMRSYSEAPLEDGLRMLPEASSFRLQRKAEKPFSDLPGVDLPGARGLQEPTEMDFGHVRGRGR
jgi:hypothetical protein